jgi:hypothetical protein
MVRATALLAKPDASGSVRKWCVWVIAFLCCFQLKAQTYKVKASSFSNGASTAQSPSYKLKSTVGEEVVGSAASASYKTAAGFEPPNVIDQLPDLDFTGTLTLNPSISVTRGGNVSAFFIVKNAGTAKVETNIEVNAYLSFNQEYDVTDRPLPPTVIIGSSLAAGSEINFSNGMTFEIPADVNPGTYFVVLLVDPNGVVNERSEGNNTISSGISVTSSDDTTLPVIVPPTSFAFVNGGAIVITATDDKGIKEVVFHHKRITDSEFTPLTMTRTGNAFQLTIQNDWADDLGMEGYFIAEDNSFNKSVKPVTSYFWYRSPDASKPIPFAAGFNGKEKTFQMFSIPYELNDNDVQNIFETVLGSKDPPTWRLFHFANGDYTEYPSFRKIIHGDAYWFNAVNKDFQIIPGAGQMYAASQQESFVKTLVKGWNQIGNPYPFPIAWDAVVGSNEMVGELNFYSNGSYAKSNIFLPWTGAFVHLDQETSLQLEIPVDAKTNAPGRILRKALEPELDSEQWLMKILANAGDIEFESGIGMHPEAKTSKDKFDDIKLPSFANYFEMYTNHPEFFSPQFAVDVVPTSLSQSWTFEVRSNFENEMITLTWPQSYIAGFQSSLLLIDLHNSKWVDMKAQGSYTFTQAEGRKFRIIYNRSGAINPDITIVGDAYPNPFTNELHIPVLVGEAGTKHIEIYDGFGRLIKRIEKNFNDTGFHEVLWDLMEQQESNVNSGIYFYRLAGKEKSKLKRLIKL